MTVQRTWQGRFRGWVVILLGFFLSSLGLSQVGTLHHNHPGGDHPHVHADLAGSAFSSPQARHSETHAHPHAHPHTPHHQHYGEEHFEEAHAHHHHHDHSVESQEHDRTEPAYRQLTLFSGGHWHTFTTLHRASLATVVFFFLALFSFPLRLFAQTFLFASTPSLHHPRAPPSLR